MFAADSAVPFLVIAAVIVIAVSCITIPRLLRAAGASTIVSDSPDPGTDMVSCGFDLVKPGRLSSSQGTCTLRVADHELAVRTPVGDYRWDKGGTTLSSIRRKAFGFALRVSDEHAEADVLVRDADQLAAALQRHHWFANSE